MSEARIKILLPAGSERTMHAVVDAANAVRATRHHVLAGTAVRSSIPGGATVATSQGVATILRDPSAIGMSFEPDQGSPEFAKAAIRLPARFFPDSTLWTCAEEALADEFVRLADPIFAHGHIHVHAMPDGSEFAVIEGHADDRQAETERLVEDLAQGTDVAVGGSWNVRLRWPAMGARSGADPVSAEGDRFALPPEDHPEPSMRHARSRLLLIERRIAEVAPALMAEVAPDGVVHLLPLALTRAPLAGREADEARALAVAAFHRLSVMPDPEGLR